MTPSMMLKDAALLLLYLGRRSSITSFWTKVLGFGAGLALLLTILTLLILLVQALLVPRQLVSLSGHSQTVLGKPLLFPVKFNHTRLTPVKDRFSNRFLMIGVPVGLQCRVGSFLAVDDKSLGVSRHPLEGDAGLSWRRIRSNLNCWFSIDSARFLHRGDHGVDLREKLDNFLLSQGEDPAQWPYAYLLGVPQFLRWSRSVVSWWYLYSETRDLDATIMEINNSYGEKRNVFLRVTPASDKLVNPPEASETVKYLDDRQLVRSLLSAPQASFYKGVWHKYIFASPFEKVDGVVSNRLMDPLQPCAWKPNAPLSNMTTMEESGEVRMATRLTCDGPPIDPTQMNAFEVAKFLFRWTLPGMLTTPGIVFKALSIRFTGSMKMNSKPPVRTGSVGRPMKQLEIDLEPFFRAYLASCVEAYPHPIEVSYLPCRSFTNDIIRMQSPSYRANPKSSSSCLTVEPADPQFYTRFIQYPNVQTALTQETQPTGHTADPTARRLLVSNLTLLLSILKSASSQKTDSSGFLPPNGRQRGQLLLALCRWKSTPTFMDDFALSSTSEPSSRGVYLAACLRLANARTLAFGSQALLNLQIFLASVLLRWLALEILSVLEEKFSFNRFDLPGQLHGHNFERMARVIISLVVPYFLVIQLLALSKKWLLQG